MSDRKNVLLALIAGALLMFAFERVHVHFYVEHPHPHYMEYTR